jgi:hypothetical protein
MAVDEPHRSAAHLPEHVAPSSCRPFRSARFLHQQKPDQWHGPFLSGHTPVEEYSTRSRLSVRSTPAAACPPPKDHKQQFICPNPTSETRPRACRHKIFRGSPTSETGSRAPF